MAEWLDPNNLEDLENTTQELLNELANESDEIAGQIEFWSVRTKVATCSKQDEQFDRLLIVRLESRY